MAKKSKVLSRPPPHLSREAALVWREVVAHLRREGTCLAAYGAAIETFCMAVVRQRRLAAELDKAGAGALDKAVLRATEAAAATVKNLAQLLGLSPARKAKPKPTGGGTRAGGRGSGDKSGGVWRGVLK